MFSSKAHTEGDVDQIDSTLDTFSSYICLIELPHLATPYV